ncbi:hypothetical protein [Rugamonas sp.]|uniref:hypothetical protein n=1 Tax=Rugamonas sp. TaxID=1926287 RepID=UPI0025E71D36|nr:hypothetical protein [Rugamonas sp.]
MKKLIVLMLLAMTSSVVHAQDDVIVNAPTLRLDSNEPLHRVSSDDLGRYRGAYELSNGQTLIVRSWGARLYAALDDQPQHELAATGDHGFAARDGQLKIYIDLHDDGRASGQLLIATPPRQLADGSMSAQEPLALTLR